MGDGGGYYKTMKLNLKVIRVGNGSGVVLPKAILDACRIERGDRVLLDLLEVDKLNSNKRILFEITTRDFTIDV